MTRETMLVLLSTVPRQRLLRALARLCQSDRITLKQAGQLLAAIRSLRP